MDFYDEYDLNEVTAESLRVIKLNSRNGKKNQSRTKSEETVCVRPLTREGADMVLSVKHSPFQLSKEFKMSMTRPNTTGDVRKNKTNVTTNFNKMLININKSIGKEVEIEKNKTLNEDILRKSIKSTTVLLPPIEDEDNNVFTNTNSFLPTTNPGFIFPGNNCEQLEDPNNHQLRIFRKYKLGISPSKRLLKMSDDVNNTIYKTNLQINIESPTNQTLENAIFTPISPVDMSKTYRKLFPQPVSEEEMQEHKAEFKINKSIKSHIVLKTNGNISKHADRRKYKPLVEIKDKFTIFGNSIDSFKVNDPNPTSAHTFDKLFKGKAPLYTPATFRIPIKKVIKSFDDENNKQKEIKDDDNDEFLDINNTYDDTIFDNSSKPSTRPTSSHQNSRPHTPGLPKSGPNVEINFEKSMHNIDVIEASIDPDDISASINEEASDTMESPFRLDTNQIILNKDHIIVPVYKDYPEPPIIMNGKGHIYDIEKFTEPLFLLSQRMRGSKQSSFDAMQEQVGPVIVDPETVESEGLIVPNVAYAPPVKTIPLTLSQRAFSRVEAANAIDAVRRKEENKIREEKREIKNAIRRKKGIKEYIPLTYEEKLITKPMILQLTTTGVDNIGGIVLCNPSAVRKDAIALTDFSSECILIDGKWCKNPLKEPSIGVFKGKPIFINPPKPNEIVIVQNLNTKILPSKILSDTNIISDE